MGSTNYILSDYWSDPAIERLSWNGKGFYLYLMTNSKRNEAGLYEITTDRIQYETKLEGSEIHTIMKELGTKVVWYEDKNIIWVKSLLARRVKNVPWLLKACMEVVEQVKERPILDKFFDYNQKFIDSLLPKGLDREKFNKIRWCDGCSRPESVCACKKGSD